MKLSSRLLYTLIREQLDDPVDFSRWKINAHHVTLNMGSWDGPEKLGDWFDVVVEGLYYNDKVAALKVELPGGPKRPSGQEHITIAVSPTGKAKDSNDLPWSNPPIPVSVAGLKGQLQDHKMTGGGYTGVVLTVEGHRKLISGLAAAGFNFPENTSQKWAEETLLSVAQESHRIPLTTVQRIINEELVTARKTIR